MSETTHVEDPKTGRWIQIVSPEKLRAVLDAAGDDYSRPDFLAADEEWSVAGVEAP